jgi:hypothetical protein
LLCPSGTLFPSGTSRFFINFILEVGAMSSVLFRSRADLAIEILALQQHVAVLKRKRPRPPLRWSDQLFWIMLRQFWSGWKKVLAVVKPDTVVARHRAAFRCYWRWKSRPPRGRPRIRAEIRDLSCASSDSSCQNEPLLVVSVGSGGAAIPKGSG